MKILKFILILILSIQFSYAQDVDLGIRLGANFSSFEDVSGFDNKVGFTAGAFVGLKFNWFGIQPEVLYSQQGAKLDLNEFDLDYINVPVLFKFYINDCVNFHFGPQYGILINDDGFVDSILSNFEAETYEFSGVGGLGINLPLGFSADIRYTIGITDTFEEVEWRSGVINLSLAYSFL